MSLLGLELSDAGILVAGAEPARLLKVDGDSIESPGFALPEKNRLEVGRPAERKAHLFPRQILNQYWDRLSIEPLDQPNRIVQNHAEIAFAHLAHIWKTVKDSGQEAIIAVPGFYTREHLGYILGITQELGIPIKGFVPMAIAAVPSQLPKGLLLHLDLHLHRFEVTRLARVTRLSREESISAEGSGVDKLFRRWVDAIAEEFVRNTRFDPLHRAATEQELYDRLPGVLKEVCRNSEVSFEMTGGSKVYRVKLTSDFFYNKAAPIFEEMRRLVNRFYEQYGDAESERVLMLTDRIARLPGLKEMLAGIENCSTIALEPGAGALGVLEFGSRLFKQQAGDSVPFLTSRPLPDEGSVSEKKNDASLETQQRPTHILYRNLAHPITEKPFIIGLEKVAPGSGIRIRGQIAGVSRKHCDIQLQGNRVVLTDHSTYGTFVDENPINGKTTLLLGQQVRVGTPGETLKLIACLEREIDET